MKKYFLLILLSHFGLFAQTPTWNWLTKSIGSDYVGSRSISLDNTENIYTVGNYSTSTFTYGNLTLTNTSLASARDSYIAKHNSLGEIIWLKGISGSNNEEILKVKTDNNNNLYVLGGFNSPVLTIGNTTLTNSGYYDIYLAKFNSNGDLVWVKSISGANNESAEGLTVDSSGNIYVGGKFNSSSITIGSSVLNNSTSFAEAFLIKFDSSGNPLWNKVLSGSVDEYIEGINTDNSGNVFITGGFNSSSINFGTTTLTNTNAYNDIFIAKYNSTGIFQWAKKIGGNNDDYTRNIKIDTNGDILVTGHFTSTSLTLGTTTLSKISSQDIFITKYNTSGNLIWAKNAGNSGYNVATGLTTDTNNNIYISGAYNNSITFGTQPELISTGNQDVFLAKYDTAGNAVWSKSNGGIYNDFGFAITNNSLNDIFLTGTLGPQSNLFDTVDAYSSTGFNFIAKLSLTNLNNETFSKNKPFICQNPVREKICISNLINFKNYLIFDVTGKTILSSKFDNYSSEIDVKNLQTGIYFLKIDENEAIKFIKN